MFCYQILFYFYIEKIIEELDDLEEVRAGGLNVKNVRYAYDTVLISVTKEKLQELLSALNTNCVEKGSKFNVGRGKTEVMELTKKAKILL